LSASRPNRLARIDHILVFMTAAACDGKSTGQPLFITG
jgi:hypothetical protein